MLGVYEYTVPKGTTEVDTVAVQMMNLIYSHLDGNILSELSKQKPDWVSIDSEETILDVISFGFQGTQYCILAVNINTNSNSYNEIRVYCKTIRGIRDENIASFSRADFDSFNKTYRFLIGVHSDYFIISNASRNQFLTIKMDAPTNPDDKNVFITLVPSVNDYNAYNKAFGTEDISLINPVLISDSGSISPLYVSSFRKNFYNQKMPVYNIYAFNEVYGVRGKISRLVMLPVSIASVGEYYQLTGINYICISRYYFDEIGSSLLLQYE